MKLLATIVIAFAFGAVVLAGPIILHSGAINLPNLDGTFSEESSSGVSVIHVYSTLSAAQYALFASNPETLYAAYLDGSLEISADAYRARATTMGSSWFTISDVYGEEEDAYIAGVFIYSDAASGATYYIARALHVVTSDDMFEDTNVTDLAAGASRWEVIAPPAPVAVACTAVSVTNGVLYATYSISDASRFGEIAAGGRTLVSVAADLGRTTGVANVSSPVSLDAATGVFRVVVDPGAAYRAAHSSLFVFGFSKPE